MSLYHANCDNHLLAIPDSMLAASGNEVLKTKKIADKIVFWFCVVPAMQRRQIMEETTTKWLRNRYFCLAVAR